jgi:hypothetical protein
MERHDNKPCSAIAVPRKIRRVIAGFTIQPIEYKHCFYSLAANPIFSRTVPTLVQIAPAKSGGSDFHCLDGDLREYVPKSVYVP